MPEKSKNQLLIQFEDTLNEYFGEKAPAMPENIKDLIVKIAPYLVLLGLIFAIPSLLLLVGLGGFATMMSPFGGMHTMSYIPTMWLGIILLIPIVILEAMALPGLFSKTQTAWRYIFWAELISIVSGLLQFNIIGTLIGAIICFYLLFQVRSLYK